MVFIKTNRDSDIVEYDFFQVILRMILLHLVIRSKSVSVYIVSTETSVCMEENMVENTFYENLYGFIATSYILIRRFLEFLVPDHKRLKNRVNFRNSPERNFNLR